MSSTDKTVASAGDPLESQKDAGQPQESTEGGQEPPPESHNIEEASQNTPALPVTTPREVGDASRCEEGAALKNELDQSPTAPQASTGLVKNEELKFEESLTVNIANEVASAFIDLGGVRSEIKSAFKEVHSEFVSAVSEVKQELSHVLTCSLDTVSGAHEQVSVSNSDIPDSLRESESVGNITCIRDISGSTDQYNNDDVLSCENSLNPSSLEKEFTLNNECQSNDVKVGADLVEEPSEPAELRPKCEQILGGAEEDSSAMKITTDTKPEDSVDNSNNGNTDYSSSYGDNFQVLMMKGISVDEIREDTSKEIAVPEKDAGGLENVFASQSGQDVISGCDEAQNSNLLSSTETWKGSRVQQPLSAPSTPVPSGSGSMRKVLRTQICRGRRVSFPEDETHLISSYLEPVNPWQQMGGVSVEEIVTAYRSSCERHRTQPLPGILQQIKALPLVGGRVECITLRGQKLDGNQCECLEEIFRRVQFKILDLEGCSLDDDTAIPLFDMIEFYDSATQLNISCNENIGFRGWQACSRMLKRTPSVEYLDARNTNLNETNMPILGRALRLGARLHTLHLESCNLTGRPLMMLTAALKQNDTLYDLYLAENRLGVNDCIQLGNLVRANSTLRLLDLRNNNVQDVGCSHICEGIVEQQKMQLAAANENSSKENNSEKTKLKGLHSLVLWNNHLTQHSATHLASMLSVTKVLEILNLGRNNLTSEGILRLKESLMRNHTLLRLGLQAGRITDEGAVALAEYTADNRMIQHIDLRENPVRVAGLMALAHSLRLNSTLIQMDLDSDPKSEPSAELAQQHFQLQKEIKEYCQRNLTLSHLKNAEGQLAGDAAKNEKKSFGEGTRFVAVTRKISLTCETTTSHQPPERLVSLNFEEKHKYISPAPSPNPSPSPSPCTSPSPSPVPSPQKNRFRVFKVQESSKSSPNLMANISQSSILASSVPVSQAGRSMSAGDLSKPTKSTVRPNRFGSGGRFTVTKVAEPSGPHSLPSHKEVTSSAVTSSGTPGPKIVISSPIRVERGFSVDRISSKILEKAESIQEKSESSMSLHCKSVGLPDNINKPDHVRLKSDSNSVDGADPKLTECTKKELSSPKSLGIGSLSDSHTSEVDTDSVSSSDLTDSGFLDEGGSGKGGNSLSPSPSSPNPEGDRDSLLSSSVESTNQEDNGKLSPNTSNIQDSLSSIPFLTSAMQQFNLHYLDDPPKRAPLAAMENGSFDSDSEDSELTTQSSDSTHSDEVKVTTEQYEPKPAWGSKQEQPDAPVSTDVSPAVTGSS